MRTDDFAHAMTKNKNKKATLKSNRTNMQLHSTLRQTEKNKIYTKKERRGGGGGGGGEENKGKKEVKHTTQFWAMFS